MTKNEKKMSKKTVKSKESPPMTKEDFEELEKIIYHSKSPSGTEGSGKQAKKKKSTDGGKSKNVSSKKKSSVVVDTPSSEKTSKKKGSHIFLLRRMKKM